MQTKQLTTSKIFLYQYLSLGLYFLLWCRSLGRELNEALRAHAVPSLWWFLVPGGSYYWVWRLSEALDDATGRRIKKSDTFLLYILFITVGSSIFLYPLQVISELVDLEQFDITFLLLILLVALVGTIVLIVTMHAVFMSFIQSRLNKVRGQQ